MIEWGCVEGQDLNPIQSMDRKKVWERERVERMDTITTTDDFVSSMVVHRMAYHFMYTLIQDECVCVCVPKYGSEQEWEK